MDVNISHAGGPLLFVTCCWGLSFCSDQRVGLLIFRSTSQLTFLYNGESFLKLILQKTGFVLDLESCTHYWRLWWRPLAAAVAVLLLFSPPPGCCFSQCLRYILWLPTYIYCLNCRPTCSVAMFVLERAVFLLWWSRKQVGLYR